MKQKISLFLFVLFLCNLFLLACSDKQDKEPPFLSIESKSVNFLAKAQNKSIDIKTNIVEWSVSVSPDATAWLSANKAGSNLNIRVLENQAMDVRKGAIVITADNLSETISVEQLGQAPAILLSSDIFTIESTGGEIALDVTSNIEYEIIIPSEFSWIKTKDAASTRSGMVTASFAYAVGFNLTETTRQGEIIVKQKNGELQKKVIVTQKALNDYQGGDTDGIKNDIKVPIKSGKASSFQGGQNIENSFDGNMTTLYHSAWSNGGANYFPITLDYYFENKESIDYFIYYPRSDGSNNGRFKETEIWVTTKTEPTYKKLMDYDFKGAKSAVKVILENPLIKPTAVRFIVKSGAGDGQGFASCAEMEFYRNNPDSFDFLSVFTTTLCDELKPGITLSEIEKIPIHLYRNIALYLYQNKYPKAFRIEEYKAYPHPETIARSNKTSTYSLLDNPTGISVSEGEELVVFVGDTHGQNISIKVQNLDTPDEDGYGNASFYPLSQGMNKFTMKNKGLIYLFYHTDEYESATPIKIHFATGKVNGYFDSQKHTAADWNRLLNAATDQFFDVVGKYAHLTFPTEDFRSYAGNNGLELINAYDNLVRSEQDFMGLIKYDRVPGNRAYFHVIYKAYMYSTSYRTAYNRSTASGILNPEQLKKTPWGPAHELGHTHQTRPGFKWQGTTEVTNNVHSLYIQTLWGNPSRIETEDMGRYNNRYEKAYHSSFVNHTPHPGEGDVFCKLVSLWQLQLYFAKAKGYDDFYKDFYERVRTSPDKKTAGEQQLEFVKMMCDVSKTDLTDFFKKWGYLTPFDEIIDDYGNGELKISQQQIDQTISAIKLNNYGTVNEKIEYICDSNWEVFKNKLPVQKGTAVQSGKNIRMNNWKNVVAYEVYENDELVFVSNKNTFDLDNAPNGNTKMYAVAYNGSKTEVKF